MQLIDEFLCVLAQFFVVLKDATVLYCLLSLWTNFVSPSKFIIFLQRHLHPFFR